MRAPRERVHRSRMGAFPSRGIRRLLPLAVAPRKGERLVSIEEVTLVPGFMPVVGDIDVNGEDCGGRGAQAGEPGIERRTDSLEEMYFERDESPGPLLAETTVPPSTSRRASVRSRHSRAYCDPRRRSMRRVTSMRGRSLGPPFVRRLRTACRGERARRPLSNRRRRQTHSSIHQCHAAR